MTRWAEVDPQRLAGWFERFADRHGELRWDGDRAVAADGCVAVHPGHQRDGWLPAPRRRGLLLVRLGGYAVGIALGPRLVESKVGSRPVHGRSAAGGWSQHRFARRREGQARLALDAAAGTAARLLVGAGLQEVVCGGDRGAVTTVLADPRLRAVRELVTPRLLDVVDPKLAVLREVAVRADRVRVEICDATDCRDPHRPRA